MCFMTFPRPTELNDVSQCGIEEREEVRDKCYKEQPLNDSRPLFAKGKQKWSI